MRSVLSQPLQARLDRITARGFQEEGRILATSCPVCMQLQYGTWSKLPPHPSLLACGFCACQPLSPKQGCSPSLHTPNFQAAASQSVS